MNLDIIIPTVLITIAIEVVIYSVYQIYKINKDIEKDMNDIKYAKYDDIVVTQNDCRAYYLIVSDRLDKLEQQIRSKKKSDRSKK